MQINRRLFFAAAAGASAPVAAFAAGDDDIATVQRQAQELNDAVTYGRADVWSRYMHDDGVYTDEEGTRSTKAEIVAQIGPLPAGISGVLTTQDFRAKRTGDVIVTTYVIDEHETYHGAALHCQYRNTVTWVRSGGMWKILALQTIALRADPPETMLTQLDDYVGSYRLSSDVTYTVTRAADGLAGQQTGGRARPLKAEVRDLFFNPGRPRYRFLFMRTGDGRVDRMIERREAWDIVWMRER
jgi:ketosteroid isomerase-like protein